MTLGALAVPVGFLGVGLAASPAPAQSEEVCPLVSQLGSPTLNNNFGCQQF